jgi:hypothetical protein
MPYITKEQREEIDGYIANLCMRLGDDPGERNYVITKIIHDYIAKTGLRYKNLNSAVGILECAKAEFIRTVVSPYEDEKIKENGNVSFLDKEV